MHWSFVWIGYLISWGLIPFILWRNKPPVSTLAWVWSVVLFPYVGPLAYMVLGNDRLARKRLRAGRKLSAASGRDDQTYPVARDADVTQLFVALSSTFPLRDSAVLVGAQK